MIFNMILTVIYLLGLVKGRQSVYGIPSRWSGSSWESSLGRTRFGSCTMTHQISLFGIAAMIFFEILILIVVQEGNTLA
jgi:hypothetical protein